jgi:hypothetical protein
MFNELWWDVGVRRPEPRSMMHNFHDQDIRH